MKKHRINRILVIYIIVSLCFTFTPMFDIPSVRAGSTYYVATTGDDTGAGTIGDPFATIQRALNASGDGDTVYVRGGNYNNIWSPTVGLRIKHDDFTLSGYQDEVAIINGDSYTISSSYGLLNIGTCSASYNCDNVTIQNLVIENSTSNGIKIHSCGTGVSDDITISNVTFNNIYLRGFIAWSGRTDIHSINNTEVKDCWFNNTQAKLPPSMGEGVTFYGCQNVSFHDNLLTNCPKIMLDFANNTKNVACYNNTFVTTRGTAIKCDGSQSTDAAAPAYDSNISIYNNLFYGTYRAIYIQAEKYGGCDNISVYNNIMNLTNTTEALFPIKLSTSNPYLGTLDNISITYNTIYLRDGTAGACITMEIYQELSTNFVVANNIFQTAGNIDYQVHSTKLNSTDPCLHFHNNTYNHTSKVTNTYWYGGVTHKFESSFINASPEFVDIATYNFHLNDTSPCIDDATSNYTVATDFGYASRPQGVNYDVGAYEFIQSSWSGTLFEFYDGPPYGGISVGGPIWKAQTFTVGTVGSNINHTIESVGLRLFRFSQLDIVNVGIFAVDGDGKPTGTNLSWGTTNTSGLTQDSFGEWRIINMTSYVLQNDTKYAIVVNIGDFLMFGWTYSTEPLYAGGSYGDSNDYGTTWTMDTSKDFLFRVYGKGVINITAHSPITGTENVSNINTILSVSVNHTEGENMEVNWYSNNSGPWTLLATNITTGNEVVYQTNTEFSEYGTIYYWNVSVKEGDNTLESDIYWFRTIYAPQNPTNINTTYVSPSLNITWTAGLWTDRTIVVRNNNSEPTDHTDGWVAYNGTLLYYNNTDVYNLSYFKLYGYNATSQFYSSGVLATWGGMEINAYNESNNASIASFTVFITNESGSETYYYDGATNPHIIDLNDLPTGSHVAIQINATGYNARDYYMDLATNNWYDLNAYLPPENISHLYVLIVYDEYFYPVDDAKMEVKRYINESVGFEDISIEYTDASGKISLYLVEGIKHKVVISKEGYETETSDFDTDPDYYGVIYPIEFQLHSSVEEPELYEFWYLIKFNATMYSNNSMRVMYEDTYTNTTDAQFYTYANFNFSTNLLFTNTTTSDTFVFWVNGINISREHEVFIYLNHTNLGYTVHSIIVFPLPTPSYSDIEMKLRAVGGNFELDFVPFLFVYIPAIILLVIFGKSHPGMGVVGSGLWMGFVGIYLAIPAEAAALAPFIVCIGIILIYVKGGKSKL